MLKQNLKNILRLAYLCFLLLILGFITLISSASSPTLAQSNWTTYEDNDPLVLPGYSEGDWQTVSVPEAVGGNLTWTDVPSAELVLYFEGSAIEILYSRGPEGGDFHINLDDMTWPQFNSYAEQYLYGTSIQQFNLAPGVHQLVITNDDGAFWLEAIRIQGVLIQVILDSPQNPSPQQPVFVQQGTTFTQDFEDNIYGPEEARPVVTGSPYMAIDYYRNVNPYLGYYLPENPTRLTMAYSSNTADTIINLQVDLTMGTAPNDIYTVYGLSFYSQSGILYYPPMPPIHINAIRVILLDANNVILYQYVCNTYCKPSIPIPVSNVKTVRLHYSAFSTYRYLMYFVAFDNIVIQAEPDPCAGKSFVNPLTVTALWEYGVQVVCEGDRDWEENELETILTGVTDTANALHQFNQSGNYVPTADGKSLFKQVMGNLKVMRLDNGTSISLGGCDGSQDTACTYNEGNTLAFYGNVASRPTGFSKQLVVHELGHRFDYRSAVTVIPGLESGNFPEYTGSRSWDRRALSNLVNQTGCGDMRNPESSLPRCPLIRDYAIVDDIGNIVMNGINRRTIRGWGSGPDGVVSLYQQSDLDSAIEVAADMFLNWVHSTNHGVNVQGFRDKKWSGREGDNGISCATEVGCDDPTHPGQALFARMNGEWMPLIFSNNAWH